MALRSWGLGRVALVTLSYWAAVAAAGVAWSLHLAAAQVAAYEAAHPGASFMTTVDAPWSPAAAWVVLLGPPLALTALWIRARRR